MFSLEVTKNQIKLKSSEPMTSGSQNVYVCQFSFSEEWDVLDKTAVFATDVGASGPVAEEVYNQILGEDSRCFIPWEVNKLQGRHVYVGVFGTMDGTVVLPTVWIDLGNVLLGVTTGLEIQPPTPTLWEQMLSELYLIRRDIKNIEVGSSLEVMDMININNANAFTGLDLPRSIIMLNSSLYVSDEYGSVSVSLPFISDVIQVSKDAYVDENQNESLAIYVSTLSGNTVALPYNEEGFFTSMIPVKDEINIDDFLAKGTYVMHNFGDITPKVGTAHNIFSTEFIGREPVSGDVIRGLGWNTDGNLYRFAAIFAPNENDIWTAELTEVEWIKVVGADGADGQDGQDGSDGFSPTVEVIEIEGGRQVTITDADGPKTFNVMDGAAGASGGGVAEIAEDVYIHSAEEFFQAIDLDADNDYDYIGFVRASNGVGVIVGDSNHSLSNSVFWSTCQFNRVPNFSGGNVTLTYVRTLDIYNGSIHFRFVTDECSSIDEAFSAPFSSYGSETFASKSYVDDAVASIPSGAEFPDGEANQVLGYNEEGEVTAKTIENTMMPIVDVAHGGTGFTTEVNAMTNFIDALTVDNPSESASMPESYIPYYNNEASGARKMNVNTLRKAIVGTETPIVNGNADYNTFRARAIYLGTTAPAAANGLVNGTIYANYVS